MDSAEAWKRTQYRDHFLALKTYVELYESGDLSPTELDDVVRAWVKNQAPKKYDPFLEGLLREEWVQHGNIDVFRIYGEKGMSYRDMGRICGVSAASISRWLDGTRTRRT